MQPGDAEWPQPSSAAATAIMRSNRGADTRPELVVRGLVHAAGLRYRTTLSIILGPRRWTRPDLTFTRARVAVYVDGCFWHGCPAHRTHPKANAAYWSAKIERNAARDVDTTARLEALGWTVLRFWEHEDPVDVAAAVVGAVRDASCC